MDPQQLTSMAHKFQAVLDADVLNERGEQLGFCQRQRLITPFRFGLSVIASMATEQVASLADLHRQFNDLWDGESTYKAFYNQMLTASCGEFLRTALCDIMGKLTRKQLLESLSRKDVAPIRGYPYNLRAYDGVFVIFVVV